MLRLALVTTTLALLVGCRLLASHVPCESEDNCQLDESCVVGACVPRESARVDAGRLDDDGGKPVDEDAGNVVADGGVPPADAGSLDAGDVVDAGGSVDAGRDGGLADAGEVPCSDDGDCPGALCDEGVCVAEIVVLLEASVTGCLALAIPDSTAADCRTAGHFQVDLATFDYGAVSEARGFVRFELGDVSAARRVAAAELELFNDDLGVAGDVWRSEIFAEAELVTNAPPDPVALLASGPGIVSPGTLVTWTLDASGIAAGEPLCLALIAAADNGVNYRDETSDVPPVLRVTLAPP